MESTTRLVVEDRRRLHLQMGYASMFELLTRHFGYSEGAASQVQQFLRNQTKQGKRYTPEQKSELTRKMEGKSRRERMLDPESRKPRRVLKASAQAPSPASDDAVIRPPVELRVRG